MRKLMKNKKNRIRKRIISGTVAFALVMSSLLPGTYSGNTKVVGETTAKEEKVVDGSKLTKDEFDKIMEDHKVGDTIKGTVDGLTSQELEVKASKSKTDKVVSLEGLMPEDAKGKVTDVTSKYQNDTKEVLAAYDISILDGKKEYQPRAKKPIRVEIKDKRIKKKDDIAVFHIDDDGNRQRVIDFKVVDGAISFRATGFSVYEIVDGVKSVSGIASWKTVSTIEEIIQYGKESEEEDDEGGFYLTSGSGSVGKDKFLTNSLISGVGGSTDRYGIQTTSNAYPDEPPVDQAAKYYFECPDESKNEFYIYTKIDGVKHYAKMYAINTGNDQQKKDRCGLTLTSEEDEKNLFILEYVKPSVTDTAKASIDSAIPSNIISIIISNVIILFPSICY